MELPFFRTGFNYDADSESQRLATVNSEPSLTVQSEAEDADINVIVKRFGIGGALPTGVEPPSFADVSDVMDFQSALNYVRESGEKFMLFPAEVRARFANDPQRFLEFCTAEKDGKLVNLDAMREIGLAVPKQEAVPAPSGAPSAPPAK